MNILKNNKGISLLEVMIIFFIIGILAAMAIPNYRRGSGRNPAKACASNIRVLQCAIEMYNMDNKEMIRDIDDNTQEILIKGHYLKGKPLECPGYTSERGKYQNLGDLTENGILFCDYHGSTEGIKITPGMSIIDYNYKVESMEREREQARIEKERKEMFEKIAVGGGILGFIILLIILIPQKRKKA